MEARIDALRDKLSRAVLIDPSQLPKDEVAFGSTVGVKDLDFGDEEEFTLVGAGEEDYDTRQDPRHQPAGPGTDGQEGRRAGRDRRAAGTLIRDPGDPGGDQRQQSFSIARTRG